MVGVEAGNCSMNMKVQLFKLKNILELCYTTVYIQLTLTGDLKMVKMEQN